MVVWATQLSVLVTLDFKSTGLSVSSDPSVCLLAAGVPILAQVRRIHICSIQ